MAVNTCSRRDPIQGGSLGIFLCFICTFRFFCSSSCAHGGNSFVQISPPESLCKRIMKEAAPALGDIAKDMVGDVEMPGMDMGISMPSMGGMPGMPGMPGMGSIGKTGMPNMAGFLGLFTAKAPMGGIAGAATHINESPELTGSFFLKNKDLVEQFMIKSRPKLEPAQ